MYKKMIAGLIGLAAFVTVSVGATNASASSATVQINGTTVTRQHLRTSTYYQTTKATKMSLEYAKIDSATDKSYSKTITLPKGTIIAGKLTKSSTTGKMNADMSLMGDLVGGEPLHYTLVNKAAKKGYVADGLGTSTTPSAFKRVSTPAYIPTWSYGDLYLGGSSAAKQFLASYPNQKVQITTDGYVEVHQKGSAKNWEFYYANKPVTAAKIKKTTAKGTTRYLYLSSSLKGIKTTRVGNKGAYEYRLALKNLHDPLKLPAINEDSNVPTFVSRYSLGGVAYYTPIVDWNSSDF
ncbi:hypothetical protein [Secundilactobacillus silagei]|uniref:Surface layer protein A domain-containing protein n=2 Tax=Secundilactobacillus silagei TaxID=1293415 RepID=A0A1Z5IHZ9_9LACO|nr:hypothetical protein [Secundilactobacillus silagei]TDG67383.1 hypothetical protein C5L25_000979 [Secundilactobacillus silagei JCM 19001]GAX01326.1 hypothetical protein IWT126_01352 [Secundilactobacillus silagei JCM 19001]